ncbi:hypothetical protein SDJN02_26364, partial [Cucurbita argyrosperma subsp. argyrosperma]
MGNASIKYHKMLAQNRLKGPAWKECHPDLSGNDPDFTNGCMFINEVYEVLCDQLKWMVYDEVHGYALT